MFRNITKKMREKTTPLNMSDMSTWSLNLRLLLDLVRSEYFGVFFLGAPFDLNVFSNFLLFKEMEYI